MNKLYTNHKDCQKDALEYAKNNRLEFLSFSVSRQNIDDIVALYKTANHIVICLEGLNKSNVCDSLLIPLEENMKDIHLFASSKTMDIKLTLFSRFDDYIVADGENKALDFLLNSKTSKEEYSNLKFWLDLADALAVTHDVKRLRKVNDIIKDIQLTTNNTLWEYYYGLITA